MHQQIEQVTRRITERSRASREQYLSRMESWISREPRRVSLSCGNLAHGFAACGDSDKQALADGRVPNIGIVTAYNDMLSAHRPYENYPSLIRDEARRNAAVAQVAGGVPAMCDGVTQGQPGMELSLFSRDVIAMSAGIGLSHDMFDAALFLGICDKIVPGMVMASLVFGHLPSIFVPAGPMPSGLPNEEKARIRQLYAQGEVGRDELLEAESKSYHSPGTCTFYGTANSNQMLMEVMGLQLPGSSFVNPGDPLREALTRAATRRALSICAQANEFTPACRVIDEKAIVNGVVGLHATGGSTNHVIHLVAMARSAGIELSWRDISDLSEVVPLLARIYPNGSADVNRFHAAGGMGCLIGQLLDSGLLHEDVLTVWGRGLSSYRLRPELSSEGELAWSESSPLSCDESVLANLSKPFSPTGGLRMLEGNMGCAVMKISSVSPQRHVIEAPAIVFHDQRELMDSFEAGDLDRDFVAVLRFQGPKANGMPELHKLVQPLGALQDRGFRVALVTDGRMSGASGKIPAAIHVTPEAAAGGAIALVRDGDLIRLDAPSGELNLKVDSKLLSSRSPADFDLSSNGFGMGRELFSALRSGVSRADQGASILS